MQTKWGSKTIIRDPDWRGPQFWMRLQADWDLPRPADPLGTVRAAVERKHEGR